MGTVYIVHIVDAEGPLAEQALSLRNQKKSTEDNKHPDFDSISLEQFKKFETEHRSRTYGSWEEIIEMLNIATSEEQRQKMRDSFGGAWIYNWFCMDHVGFIDNPRRRSMGMHQIFDFYLNLCQEQKAGDSLHWHYHPMTTYREAHRLAKSYLNSPELYEIIGRRLLDRKWFPKAHRAGFLDERPDSHWFLEQWIPFDLSNAASTDMDPIANADYTGGRWGDWRWAPSDWRTYHPSYDYYQLEGNCRRKIARCLMILNRLANINEQEMYKAFERAALGKPTLVGIASHDWRNLNTELNYVRYLIRKAQLKFPHIKFKFAEAVEAFNAVHPSTHEPSLKLNAQLIFDKNKYPKRIDINVEQGKIFGPQPFLAIRTRSRRIIHDNFNYGENLAQFSYDFDENSILPDDVHSIGIAANDAQGNQSIHVLYLDTHERESQRVGF